MKSRIIETNSAPFKRIDVDTVTVDIIENALRNARVEMDAVLFRTAMSPGIREQGDCFPMIANRDGKMVVGQFGSFIHGFMDAYEGELHEGDVILTNDPYMCNAAVSHLPDWIVLVPVFKEGRHMAWSAMFGHMSDNGGMVPGSIPIKAETVFQEGIRIPPTKLYKKGVLQSDVLELILHNVRTPNWNRFDLNALVAACNTAARRCVDIASRFGDDIFYSTMEIMLERNYLAMKAIIEMIVPEEPRVFEDYVCDDGVGMGPYKIRCKMWREGSKAIFDFEGIAKELYRVTKQGGVVVWVVGDATIKGSETGTSFKQALYFKEIGFNLHDTMIWRKPNPMPYIKKELRFQFDEIVRQLDCWIIKPGQLNYILFAYAKRHVEPSYENYRNFIGELNECIAEIRRRLVAPLEDRKRMENGDVE